MFPENGGFPRKVRKVHRIYRAVARSEYPGGHIVLGGDNVPPLVEIGLTDLSKSGGATGLHTAGRSTNIDWGLPTLFQFLPQIIVVVYGFSCKKEICSASI